MAARSVRDQIDEEAVRVSDRAYPRTARALGRGGQLIRQLSDRPDRLAGRGEPGAHRPLPAGVSHAVDEKMTAVSGDGVRRRETPS